MPPVVKVLEEDIINKSLEIVREKGMQALNARFLSSRLGCSTQPIFRAFSSMQELKNRVILEVENLYLGYVNDFKKRAKQGSFPFYLATSLAYIQFAKQEPQFFKLYFMRDRTLEKLPRRIEDANLEQTLAEIEKLLGVDKDSAYFYHLHMWVFVHGLASMIVTNYLDFDEDQIDAMLSHQHLALVALIKPAVKK